MPGFNPKQMEKMMKQMGIKNTPIEAKRVVIETGEGNLVIGDPQVMMVEMHGQKTFQVSGDVSEEGASSDGDIRMVMEKTGKSRGEAEAALEKSGGDIAGAILSLS